MNTKNLIIIGILIVGVYMIFFNKKSEKLPENAETKSKSKKSGCGCSGNKQAPQVAPEL